MKEHTEVRKARSCFVLAIAVTALAYASNAFAAWTTDGPCGASINDIELNPNNDRIVYVTDGRVVYRSINQAETFTSYSEGFLANENIRAIAVHPVFPNLIYAAGKHFYKSINGGTAWQEIGNGLPPLATNSHIGHTDILIDPTSPDIIYVATYVLYNGQYGGVYKSTDRGENFFDITPVDKQVFRAASLTIDARNHNILYAGLWGCGVSGGIWKTTDGGATWVDNTVMSPEHTIYAVKAHPNVPGLLFAGGLWYGCWRSDDYGETWDLVVPTSSYCYAASYADIDVQGHTVYYACEGAGLFRSTDAGVLWTHLENEIPPNAIYEVCTGSITEDLVFVGGALWLNLYKSVDNGNSFRPLCNGFSQVGISCVAAPTIPSKTVYSGTPMSIGGIFKTENNGADWFQTMFPTFPVHEVAVCPNNPNIVMGVLNDVFIGTPGADYFVHRSTDGGEHWILVMGGLPGAGEIAFDPINTSNVYMAIPNDMPPHFYKSVNYGASFTPIYDQGIDLRYVSSLVIENTSTFYAGVNNCGVYKSTNGGYNWSAVNNGMPESTNVNSLSKCYLLDGGIVAGTDNGVYRTTNGGVDWHQVGTLDCSINDVFSGNSVTIHGHVSIVHPVLWAATNQGVYEYLNGNWCARNEGLDTPVVKELTMTIPGVMSNARSINHVLPSRQYSVLHAATPCGTYEYTLAAAAPVANTQGNEMSSVGIDIELQVLPSLISNRHAQVSFTLMSPTKIDLSVYDLTGRLCQTLISTTMAAGNHQIPVDVNLPAGVYFYKLETESDIRATSKVTIIE